MDSTIFVQIASYRDRQLASTLKDLLANAESPERLRICVCWQHSPEDEWDTLDQYKNDPRFLILDVPHTESQGVCWARNMIQSVYGGEDYTLQLDSHHRFAPRWDTTLLGMAEDLRSKGHDKPVLTAYVPSYDPENDPAGRVADPWVMHVDKFAPEGVVLFRPGVMPNWQHLDAPVPTAWYSGHFAFAPRSFCFEVPHDPHLYFHGEEISIAARAYTWGYDLFHPHRVVCWHEYTRKGRTKHWDDDATWWKRNDASHARNRKLFEMDGETRGVDFGRYGFGPVRTLEQYEQYSGLNFKTREMRRDR